jgi:hypothetical protein
MIIETIHTFFKSYIDQQIKLAKEKVGIIKFQKWNSNKLTNEDAHLYLTLHHNVPNLTLWNIVLFFFLDCQGYLYPLVLNYSFLHLPQYLVWQLQHSWGSICTLLDVLVGLRCLIQLCVELVLEVCFSDPYKSKQTRIWNPWVRFEALQLSPLLIVH